jgi:uncharacterized protein YdhG (YjbR/CyaY superfamily)
MPKARPATASSPDDVERYLAALPDGQRAALERLRVTIRAAAPESTEVISYQLPTFKLGRPLVAYGAAKNHCSFYVMSPEVMEAHRDELARYDTSKGTVRFQPKKPLPATLVRKLVRARIAENKKLDARRPARKPVAARA